VNTQEYGRRPYGVGFLVIGLDHTGPHLYEFSPSGTSYEYFAVSIGARSQSAKTYLEKHFESFADCTVSLSFFFAMFCSSIVYCGRAVIPHSNPDDFSRQPRRTYPARVACAPRNAAAGQGAYNE